MLDLKLIKYCYYIFNNNYKFLHKFWIRTSTNLSSNPFIFFKTLYFMSLLLTQNKKILFQNTSTTSLYFKALSEYLHGNYEISINLIKKNILLSPKHWESYYLLFDNLIEINKKQEAIHEILKIANRKKTWLKLANIVENEEDFNTLYTHYRTAIKTNKIKEDTNIIKEYIALAAQRAKLYPIAIKLWEEITQDPHYTNSTKKILLNQELGKKAIHDLATIANNFNIKIFMISGTLLGFIRENALLKHDSDLDFGIFETDNITQLIQAIKTSGVFFVLPNYSRNSVRIKHINGTPIDIFIHFKENNQYCHNGIKVNWYNRLFNIKKINYLNLDLYIPENPELYLEENYGSDWKIPKEKFDSTFDCPNGIINNYNEIKIHCLKNKIPYPYEK